MACMTPVAGQNGIAVTVHVVCVCTAVNVDIDIPRRYVFPLYRFNVPERVFDADMGDPTISACNVTTFQNSVRKDEVPFENQNITQVYAPILRLNMNCVFMPIRA